MLRELSETRQVPGDPRRRWFMSPRCDLIVWLRDDETVVRLIASTTTAKGLTVTCRLDRRKYPAGRKVSDEELAAINITPSRFHGEWNYIIHPYADKEL